ncbi:MAG: superoxide dismutase [Alphaproteobacteria bacterium]|nr:superoxide dismutase [Alphaproteobacteria bacterium]
MPFELPPLPYAENALAPYMSSQTLSFHHGKHHKAYVDKLNKLIEGTPYAKASLETIIEDSFEDEKNKGIFNNAAQVWNHSFFWNCMKPGGGGAPKGEMARHIDAAFGSYEDFAKKFKETAVDQFGSGWAWLILDQGKLNIIKTPNAVNPLSYGQRALLTCDVWEHAYYLDYQNRRPDMVQAFLDHLVNWDFVQRNLP